MGKFLALAAGGLQGIGTLMTGDAEKQAADQRALELRQQALMVSSQAKEQQATRQDQLNRSISAITALTASRNLNPDTPSAQAITGQRKKTAQTDIVGIGLNAATQAGLLREDALAAIMAGNNAQMNSWFQAATAPLNQFTKYAG